MATHPLLRMLFVISVWLLTGISAWQFMQFAIWPERYQTVPSAFQTRVFPGPLMIGGMALLFWFRLYAQERQGARVLRQ